MARPLSSFETNFLIAMGILFFVGMTLTQCGFSCEVRSTPAEVAE